MNSHSNPHRPEQVAKLLTLNQLIAATGMTQSELISTAIDRMYHQIKGERTMNAQQARELAIQAIEVASKEGEPVADMTVVGKDENGYWVSDNGEEVSGLTKAQAIDIIVENLTAE